VHGARTKPSNGSASSPAPACSRSRSEAANRFARLVRRLHDETPLAVSFTTNGLLLDEQNLRDLGGAYGEIRLSLYDDNHWRERVRLLAGAGARFGVNWLMTPARLARLEETLCELVELGARRVLVLSYNGRDRALHLDREQTRDLELRVNALSRALARRCQLELDVCWGERLERVPRLFSKADCGAGREFVVLTSDKRVQPCSFHQLAFPVASAQELLDAWRARREELASASTLPGCARVKGFGLVELRA
jgi:MoaA/NifB/PqqE/SkfB family radical SAM enzyme